MPVGNVAKVEAYLAKVPAPQRKLLERLRKQIQSAAPAAEEGFGYGLPGFYLDGPVFYYGAAKAHCALYGVAPDGFEDALEGFVRSKGTVRFTPEKPLPAALVKALVKARVVENKARAAAKGTGKAVKGKAKAGKRKSRNVH